MKEKIIIVLCILGLLSGCSSQNSKSNKDNQEIYEIYKLSEQTTIYSTYFEPEIIKENGEKINIKEELSSGSISLEDIISTMELYTTANDGGSQIYKSQNQNLYLVQCNSLPENGGVKDVYLSDSVDKIVSFCTK